MSTARPGRSSRLRAATPLESLWQPRVVGWVVAAGEGLALVLTLAPGVTTARWAYFGLASLAIQWVGLLSLGVLYLARRRLEQLPPQTVAWFALAVLVLSTLFVSASARAVLGRSWIVDSGEEWSSVALRLAGIALTVGLLGLAAFQNYWRERRAAMRAKEAELEALQARIRPHFLFNTLNTGASLVHQHPEQAERLLLDLADLFRAALAGPREVQLDEELTLTRRYLEIEALRFGERLRVEWQLPAEIPAIPVPALSIQPLVENAIRHGIERIPHGGRLGIALTMASEYVVIRITNPVALSELKQPVSHQVGLHASQSRIEALTGGRGRVETGRKGELYVATVRLPRTPSPPPRAKWR